MRKITIKIISEITVSANDDADVGEIMDTFDVLFDTDEADVVDINVIDYEVIDSK